MESPEPIELPKDLVVGGLYSLVHCFFCSALGPTNKVLSGNIFPKFLKQIPKGLLYLFFLFFFWGDGVWGLCRWVQVKRVVFAVCLPGLLSVICVFLLNGLLECVVLLTDISFHILVQKQSLHVWASENW